MITSKHLLIGAGLAVFATVLVSFSNGDDPGKKKKYHVIHQKDGNLQEFDTILTMNSDYGVEEFLAEKGIENCRCTNLKNSQFRRSRNGLYRKRSVTKDNDAQK